MVAEKSTESPNFPKELFQKNGSFYHSGMFTVDYLSGITRWRCDASVVPTDIKAISKPN